MMYTYFGIFVPGLQPLYTFRFCQGDIIHRSAVRFQRPSETTESYINISFLFFQLYYMYIKCVLGTFMEHS